MATNQGFASLIPRDGDGEFLYYLMDMLTPALKRLASGTTFDEVSKRDVRQVSCAIPQEPGERSAITHVMKAVDEALRQVCEAIDRAREVKRAMLQQFFYQALGETAYADRPRQNLPPGWSLVPTEMLLSAQPKNGVSPVASTQPPGTPTFSIAAIRDGRVDLSNRTHLKYTRVSEEVAKRYRVQCGDVLIVRGNANPDLVGKAGMVNEFPDGCIYPDIAKRVAFRTDVEPKVSAAFAVLAWNHAVVHNQILRRAKTSNGTLKINNRDVGQIVMPVPSETEQSQLVEGITAVDTMIEALTLARDSQEQLKRAVANDLLSGRVRLTSAMEFAVS
jgi:type I restriction enzyme S subunit